MAVPKANDSHESYSNQLVYFAARLAANPQTAGLVDKVDALIDDLDQAHATVREARRADVRARALRDHVDGAGDKQVRALRRRVGMHDEVAFVNDRLFPRSVGYTVAPRGRPQLDRLAGVWITA